MKSLLKKILNYLLLNISINLEGKFASLEQTLEGKFASLEQNLQINKKLNIPLNENQVSNFFIEGKIPSLLLIKPNGSRIFLDPRDPYITVHYLQVGTWEPHVTNFLQKLFEESKKNGLNNSVFLDIGANIGLHSIAAHYIGYQVFAFEPDPTTFKFLLLNTKINGLAIDLNEIALGKEAGDFDFSIDSQSSGMNGLTQSESGTGFQAKLSENSKRYETIRVKVSTLDLQFSIKKFENKSALYVLKIDTEGAEGEVLEGALSTLQNLNRYAVICEMHLDNVNLIKQLSGLVELELDCNKKVKMYLLRFGQDPILLDHNDSKTWHHHGSGDIALMVGI
jgi:FkbM family methyltransferase